MSQFDTFLSYSHRDADRVGRIKEHLDKAGIRVWMDRERISLGDQFRTSITSALRSSRSITPILTQNALESDEVFKEVRFGVNAGMKIIPVVLNPNYLNNSKRWLSLLTEVNWGLFDKTASTRNLTEEILKDIVKALQNRDTRRCPVLCVYHFQGGVGKTTICGHLAAQLYHSGKPLMSVLVIDCDAQGNLSSLFLTRKQLRGLAATSQNLIGMLEPNRLRAEHGHFPPYDVAGGQADDSSIHRAQASLHFDEKTGKRFSIIPNDITGTKYSNIAEEQRGLIFQNFQNAIQKLSYDYDVILLDCNPSATLLSECALNSSTDILIPLRNDKYTADSLEKIDELLPGLYHLDYSYGQNRKMRQLWTLINFADRANLTLSNDQLCLETGVEADLLKNFYSPLKGGRDLSQFRPSLLATRVPRSGFLSSKPIATPPLDPDRPPSKNLLGFFGNLRASAVEKAISSLASEIYEKSKSDSMVIAV